jgi:branched-chain amino acid aminotransferase
MSYNIEINKIEESRLSLLDFDNIPLGRIFSDHMFVCDYERDEWKNPRIEPLSLIPIHPATMALHYGQAIFEGMKSTLDVNGIPTLICPYRNAERLNFSARRMGMPEFPVDLFVEGLKQMVKIDRDWIPPMTGSALYLRPFMFADEAFIGMRAATTYKFIIIASPSAPLYSKRIRLHAETTYIRAAKGGTGEAKAAGNYAAAIQPTEIAKRNNYDQILWLDAKEFKYIQEVGTMNVFFKINGTLITPNLDGCILNGISRICTLEVLRKRDYKVEERPISIDEVIEANNKGTLEEAFGTGTAVGVAMIDEIGYKDITVKLPKHNPVAQMVQDTVNGIRSGQMNDEFNWMVKVETALV